LYSWIRLIWQSKIVSGSTASPVFDLSQLANWASRVAFRNFSRKAVLGKWLQLAQFAQIDDPALTDRVANCASECGIGQEQPAPRCDAVGLILKALGKHLGQVFNRGRAKQFGVNCRDAVGTVRSDDGQVVHSQVFVRAFLDQADSPNASFVAG